MSCYESQDVTGCAERVTESPELLHDSREKLEADVSTYMFPWRVDMVLDWLDRQAAITEREVEHALMKAGHMAVEIERERIAELEAERDQWRDAYGDSEQLRLQLIADLDHARKWNDTWRDLVRRYEGLCDELLDERDRMRGELP